MHIIKLVQRMNAWGIYCCSYSHWFCFVYTEQFNVHYIWITAIPFLKGTIITSGAGNHG